MATKEELEQRIVQLEHALAELARKFEMADCALVRHIHDDTRHVADAPGQSSHNLATLGVGV